MVSIPAFKAFSASALPTNFATSTLVAFAELISLSLSVQALIWKNKY